MGLFRKREAVQILSEGDGKRIIRKIMYVDEQDYIEFQTRYHDTCNVLKINELIISNKDSLEKIIDRLWVYGRDNGYKCVHYDGKISENVLEWMTDLGFEQKVVLGDSNIHIRKDITEDGVNLEGEE